MKKVLPLLVGAIALSISAAPVLSQSTQPTAPTQRTQMRRPPNFLNLTAQQQTRMEQIRQQERSQIDAILTAEQKAQLQREMQNRRSPNRGENQGTPRTGEKPRQPFASLNLTAEQRSRIEAIRQSTKTQMDAVLTAEQRQQLEQHRQQHEQRRQANPQATRTR